LAFLLCFFRNKIKSLFFFFPLFFLSEMERRVDKEKSLFPKIHL